jgi:hypothetical protein
MAAIFVNKINMPARAAATRQILRAVILSDECR